MPSTARLRVAFGLVLGLVLAGVAASPAAALDGAEPMSMSQCQAAQFCVWSGAGYTGTEVGTSGTSPVPTSFQTTHSVWNRSSYAARIYSESGGAGTSVCFAPGAEGSSVSVTSGSIRVLTTTAC